MGFRRRPRPHSLAFTSIPFVYNPSSPSQFLSNHVCSTSIISSKSIILASINSAEEELFIRRQATRNRKTISPSSPPSSKKSQSNQLEFDYVTKSSNPTDSDQLSTSPQQNDEQFDFTPTPNHDSSQHTSTDTKTNQKVGIVDETKPVDTLKESTAKTKQSTTTQSEKDSKTENVTKSHSALRSLAARARMETIRLVVDTRLGAVQLPTRRETVLLAWELAFVLALLTLLRAGVASTLRWIHNRLHATRGGSKSNIPYEATVFECMQRPLEFLSLFTVGTALAEAVSRPLAATGLLRHIRTLRELGIIFAATWFLLRWIDRIRSRFALEKRFDKAQVDATSRIATVATFIVSVLIALDTIGINVQTVLAFGGIGGVAIGFAGREIISNFFGGFMIYVTRPFSVGEWIRSIEEKELNGTVEDIGWYLTRVRTWDKRPLYIPNSRFSTLIVENGSRMDNRRVLHTIHLRHEDMPVVPDIVKDIEKLLMSHQELDPRQHRLVYVDSFDEFSIKLWMSCYTKSVFLYDYRRVQQDILIKCHTIIRARGAKLATTNTRDVRPGQNTDRYGPFGRYASKLEDYSRPTTPDTAPNFAPVNSDVPGAPRYGRQNPSVNLHTIESGVDPAILAQHANATSVNSQDPDSAATVPDRASAPSKSTSAAAVAAAAAALAAARRNARRIEDNEDTRVDTSILANEGVGDPNVSNANSKVPSTTAASGQMKISAAPPIRQTPQSSSGSGGSGSSSGPSALSGTSQTGSGDHGINETGSSLGSNAIANVNDESTPGSSGVMKISAAKKPLSLGTDGKTANSKTSSAKKESIKVEKRTGDSGDMKIQSNAQTRGETSTPPKPKQNTTIASSRSTSGVMKISKARKPLNIEMDSEPNVSGGNGNQSQSNGSGSSNSGQSSSGQGGSGGKENTKDSGRNTT